jgi:hypothetical protein
LTGKTVMRFLTSLPSLMAGANEVLRCLVFDLKADFVRACLDIGRPNDGGGYGKVFGDRVALTGVSPVKAPTPPGAHLR